MKMLGLMHYFLGLEVWKRKDEIFLLQIKHTIDVLQRFGMMDCKSMTTPLVSSFRKLHESDSILDLVDSTKYSQLIGPLIYITHGRHVICYVAGVRSCMSLDIDIRLLLSMCLDTFEKYFLMDSNMHPVVR